MRYPFEYCQECGEQIGWIGRFFQFIRIPLHKCYDPNKPYKGRIVLDNFGGSRWVNVNEYFRSEKGKKLLDNMTGISRQHIKNEDT